MLPYGGNRDRFDEINRIVNDPKKARLLDGMKRATRNDHEMSWMIKSLRRWLARDDRIMKYSIFYIAFNDAVRRIPIDQLRAETVKVPDFEGDKELTRLFEMIFSGSFYDEFK